MIARRVLEDMTMGLVALSSQGAHRVSAMEMLVIILENCSQGEWRLQASQLLV